MELCQNNRQQCCRNCLPECLARPVTGLAGTSDVADIINHFNPSTATSSLSNTSYGSSSAGRLLLLSGAHQHQRGHVVGLVHISNYASVVLLGDTHIIWAGSPLEM